MANVKLSAKTELTSVASGDFVPIIDVSDTTDGANGTSKKITKANLVTGLATTDISGVTASAAEINYTDGVTSNIQTQLDTKAPTASPTFTGVVTIPTPFTLGAVSVTPTGTELNYVDGVTSAIQTQLDGKAATSHAHAASDVTSGTMATARLGSGTANSGTFLRGDQSWQAVVSADSRRTLSFDWSNAVLPDTNFASLGKTSGTNWIYKTLDFDQTTSESVYWYFRIPSDLTPTSATAKVDWTAASGTGTFTASIVTRSAADDEVIDAVTTPDSASAVTATDTLIATGDLHQFSVTLTTTGWAAGDLIQLKFSRDIADSLSADAKVLLVTVELR